ncbi:MAG: NAD(P)(+) transhydrogenase (Re/Si-specific) subunit beta, partial [Miltoncostaeaceae bacterium]
MNRVDYINIAYLVAALGFAMSLKWMSQAPTARRGVFAGEIGFVIAVVATLFQPGMTDEGYILIGVAVVVGSIIGVPLGLLVPMTSMPERIALSHAFGGLAAGLVGVSFFFIKQDFVSEFNMAVIGGEVILGFLVFTGSLMAAGKLIGWLPQRPIVYPGQNIANFLVLGAAVAAVIWLIVDPSNSYLIPVVAGLGAVFGILLIVPIGGAD